MKPEHLSFMDQLKGIARNLNQLAKAANIAGFPSVGTEVAPIIGEITGFLKRLRHDR